MEGKSEVIEDDDYGDIDDLKLEEMYELMKNKRKKQLTFKQALKKTIKRFDKLFRALAKNEN